MQDANCDQKFWAEAVNTAVYLKNRSPHKATQGTTPEEIWTGREVNLSHLKIFGCLACVHIPKNLRSKWDVKEKPYIFVGYCEDTKGYRLFDLEEKGKIIRARDVTFLENVFSVNDAEENERNVAHIKLDEEEESENPPERENQASTQSDESGDDSEAEEETQEYESLTEEEEHDSPVVLETENETGKYPKRSRNAKKYPDYVLYHTTYEPNDPKSFKEAINQEDSARWKEAMKAELQSMAINETWILVDYPKNKKIVKNKWVFRIKRNSAGDIKYKAL